MLPISGQRAAGNPVVALTLLVFAALALTLRDASPTAAAQPTSLGPVDKVVVIVLDRVTLQELASSEDFRPLMERAGVGVVSSPVQGRPTPAKYYLSLGAGDIAGGAWVREEAFGVNEVYRGGPAGDRYHARGRVRAPAGSVVELDIFSLQQTSAKLPRRPVPGALGEALRAAGRKTAVVGNADIVDPDLLLPDLIPHREAALIAMDARGIVPFGAVGKEVLQESTTLPSGVVTNEKALLGAASAALGTADLLVVHLGDVYRLIHYERVVPPDRMELLRKQAISASASLVEKIEEAAGPNARLVIIGPTPPRRLGRFIGMPPLLVVGSGVEPGVLTSPTTRRDGVVGNVDFAPSILDWLRVDVPPGLPGRAIKVQPSEAGLSVAERAETHAAAMFQVRPWMASGFIASLFALLGLAIYFGATGRTGGAGRRGVVVGSLMMLAIPTVFLTVGQWLTPSLSPLYVAALIAGSAALAAGAVALRRKVLPVVSISVLFLAVTAVDAFAGTHLIFDNVLGYSPLDGARYYGIGNEAMSIMVAATLVSLALWRTKPIASIRQAALLAAPLVAVLVIIAHPALGANMGGTFTAGIAFGLALLLWYRKRITVPGLAAVGIGALLVLVGFTLFDATRDVGVQSHLGRTGELISGKGPLLLVPVVLRKAVAGVNNSVTWVVPFVLLAAAAVATWRVQPPQTFQSLFERYPLLRGAVTATMAGGIIGLVSNDSGIVIPALMLVFLTAAFLSLIFEGGSAPDLSGAGIADAGRRTQSATAKTGRGAEREKLSATPLKDRHGT